MNDSPLHTHVAAALGGTLLRARPLRGGVDAFVDALEIGLPGGEIRTVVLRQPGAALPSEHRKDTAALEHDLLAWLTSRGLPVPRPVLLGTEHAPRPYLVMEFLAGDATLPPGPETLPQVAALLACLHATPLDGAPPLPPREDPVPGLIEWLPPRHAALRARLEAAPPVLSAPPALLHGDYWPGNLLWQDGRLTGLLDWDGAAIGDARSDLACCRLELAYLLGTEGSEAFTAAYAARAEVDLGGLAIWDAYVSAAALRYMDRWGLPPEQLAHMKRVATGWLDAACGALERGY